jgi:enolase-phosphatase E1
MKQILFDFYLCPMQIKNVKYILTDIEGTTTSVQFVYAHLFPYFREHIQELKQLTNDTEIQEAFKKTVELADSLEGLKIRSVDEVIETLLRWSNEDRKVTPLKTVQGILWKKGYESGEIKGHVYADVRPSFQTWKDKGFQMGVFSSGSIAAQKLLFGFSEAGDLCPYFSHFFDTTTGGKKEEETYSKIAEEINFKPSEILFLSDIVEELIAAAAAGFQTVQLVRSGTVANWKNTISDFTEIEL